MLFIYSSPQHWELGQDYPCFTNEAAGAGEAKPAFLKATDPGPEEAGGLRAGLRDYCPALPAADLARVRVCGLSVSPMGHLFPETQLDRPIPNRVFRA